MFQFMVLQALLVSLPYEALCKKRYKGSTSIVLENTIIIIFMLWLLVVISSVRGTFTESSFGS